MLSGIANLFNHTADNIAKIRGVRTTGLVNPKDISCVKNHAAQLCALDVILHLHRKEHGHQLNRLHGKHALYHKLLIKYQWPLSVIRDMSLSDIIIALHDELQIAALPEDAQRYLSRMTGDYYPDHFPDYLDEEWLPDSAVELLTEVQL